MAIIIGTNSFLLSLSLSINILALMAPYWAIFKENNWGLWGRCTCTWNLDGGNDNLPDWFRASQGLYTIAVGLIIISVIIVFVICCCTDKKTGSAMLVAGILLALAAICIAVAIILFGAYGADRWGLQLEGTPQLGWALWTGVAGAIVCLVTAIMHIHQSKPRY